MAATTAAYVNVGRIPQGRGDIDDNQKFTNINATTAAFNLDGGKYGVTVHATFSGGTLTLQILAQDGATWENAMTPFTGDGYQTGDLPPCQYRIFLA
jgi:hypothetical protein